MSTTINPYQSPQPVSESEVPGRIGFRTRFWPSYLLVATGTVMGLLLVDMSLALREDPLHKLAVLAVILLAQAGPTAWLAFHYRVYVSEECLRGFDFWGKYHDVPWSAISKVRPCTVIWLKYLKLYSRHSRVPVWLPLFLHGQRRFWEQVRHWGSETPLKAYCPPEG